MKLSIVKTKEGVSYLYPFILVTSLFFLWGFAHSILDVLNKHFQEVLVISKTKSALIQAVVYGGYFLMALPAGMFIKRYGYRAGIILGLLLYGLGAFLFIPGSFLMSFYFFLFSLFIIGCGLTCLETASNPYVTVLGEPENAASRLNLAQSFNGLGWIFGPLTGGLILFSDDSQASDIIYPYLIIGCSVIVIALCFIRIPLPEVKEESFSAIIEKKIAPISPFRMGSCRFIPLCCSSNRNQQFLYQLCNGNSSGNFQPDSFLIIVIRRNGIIYGRPFCRQLSDAQSKSYISTRHKRYRSHSDDAYRPDSTEMDFNYSIIFMLFI